MDKSSCKGKEWRVSIVAGAGLSNHSLSARIRIGSVGKRWSLIYTTSLPIAKVGEWFHLAVAWNGTNIDVILDGIAVNSRPWIGSIERTSSGITLGASSPDSSEASVQKEFFLTGFLDEIQIWRQSLTNDDLGWIKLHGQQKRQQVYTNKLRLGLVGHWSFDEGKGDIARDVSRPQGSASFALGILVSSSAQPRWSTDSPSRLNDIIITSENNPVTFTLNASDASQRVLQVRKTIP